MVASKLFRLNWRDVTKALLVAFLGATLVGLMGILQYGWPTWASIDELLRAGLVAVVGYLAKNFFTGSDNTLFGGDV